MTDVLREQEVSRKSFIKGGAAIAVGMSVAGSLLGGRAQAINDPTSPNPGHRGVGVVGTSANVDWWFQFNSDGTCTYFDGGTEVGNGTPTGSAQIVADEMNMTLAQMRQAPLDSFNLTTVSRVGSGAAKGLLSGTSTQRTAAAAAKLLMVNMAAKKWGVPASTLSVNWGVIKAPDGRKISYFDLMGNRIFGYAQAGGVAPDVKAANPAFTGTIASAGATVKGLLDPTQYLPLAGDRQIKLVTQSLPRMTIPDIVTGKYTYNHNIRIPGMLHGRVVRPRGKARTDQGMRVIQIDTKSISHIPNVQVVREGPGFVGVVAPKEYDAVQAAAQLKVTWDNTPKLGSVINGTLVGGSANFATVMRNNPFTKSISPTTSPAAVNAAIAGAAKTVTATFFAPHQLHAPFGPNVAIVDVHAGNQTPGATAWVYNQGAPPQSFVSAVTGLPTSAIRIISSPGAGTYGHGLYDDVVISATVMSKHVGAPVRVQYMRWDETGWDYGGPPLLADFQAGVDANGKIVGFKVDTWMNGTSVNDPASEARTGTNPVSGTTDASAGVPADTGLGIYNLGTNLKVKHGLPNYLKQSPLRGPNETQAVFTGESFVDMLAYAANMDPIHFRKINLSTSSAPSYLPGLSVAAQAADWKPRAAASAMDTGNIRRGRGIAVGTYGGSFSVVISEVEVNMKTGKITPIHLYGVQNNGLSASTGLVENQISGGMVQGSSRALHEVVEFTSVRQTSVDWVTYPILRFKDTPKVTTITLPFIAAPNGSGEPTLTPVTGSIANAFFDATAVRLFQYPMTSGYARGMINAAKAGVTVPRLGGA